MTLQKVPQCAREAQIPSPIRQVADASDAYELRRLLTALNTPRLCDRHDRFCIIEIAYTRGLIMLKAARDVRQHEWMFSRIDALHNALSLFNDALRRIKRSKEDLATPYEEKCTLGLLERDITYEAMVTISMLEAVWGAKISVDDTPDITVLFRPDVMNIQKAIAGKFVLQSRKLIPARTVA